MITEGKEKGKIAKPRPPIVPSAQRTRFSKICEVESNEAFYNNTVGTPPD